MTKQPEAGSRSWMPLVVMIGVALFVSRQKIDADKPVVDPENRPAVVAPALSTQVAALKTALAANPAKAKVLLQEYRTLRALIVKDNGATLSDTEAFRYASAAMHETRKLTDPPQVGALIDAIFEAALGGKQVLPLNDPNNMAKLLSGIDGVISACGG